MRVATRRLRSALATFRPLFDRSRTDPVRDELRWLASLLGDVRDTQVLHEQLCERVGALPGEDVLGPVARRIDIEVAAVGRPARAALEEGLEAERYTALLDALTSLVDAPPLTAKARRPARKELRRLASRAVKRFDKSAAAADAVTGALERSVLLHQVRKDAKRARYACEVAGPVVRRGSRRLAKRLKKVQDVLGAHQDSVVACARLREMGVSAHLAGENGFTFGQLRGAEAARGEEALNRYPRALRRTRTAPARRWTT